MQYPQYYRIDFDIYVKVEKNDEFVTATNQFGHSVELGRVLEGEKITQDAFKRAVVMTSASR